MNGWVVGGLLLLLYTAISVIFAHASYLHGYAKGYCDRGKEDSK
jgi:hypothetical protein